MGRIGTRSREPLYADDPCSGNAASDRCQAGHGGLTVALIPHYDNAEGGRYDTRHCYLGERRLAVMERKLPADAAVLGVDTCPMEGIEPADYDRILGLAGTEFETVVACAAGHRASDDKHATLPKVRYAASEVIQHI